MSTTIRDQRVATELSLAHIQEFQTAFDSDPRNRLSQNAVTKTTVNNIAQNRAAVVEANHTFSHTVKTGTATNQKGSGRCWMFAGLNPMRMAAAKKLNLENFELSQNYPMFWDKLEKANYFLESILATLDEPVGGRLVSHLLNSPVQDGGQWHMFVNIVRKYGALPKSAMPETESSGNTGAMNAHLTAKLREHAARLRNAHGDGAAVQQLQARKSEMLSEIYRILSIHLGTPPTDFLWQWRDKDDAFTREGRITPQEFLKKFVDYDIDSKVCLIHAPTDDKPFNKLYTIDYLGNVVGGEIVSYLNVELSVFKQAAIDQLKDGEAIWFGCDCGKMFDRELGVWDTELFDFELVYGTTCALNKAERLDYGHSAMNHAMVFTGVDLDENNRPTKWRVENSWGDTGGEKGFYVMTDDWFDEYMYEIAVDKKYLPKELLPVLKTEHVVLPPWDPMGTLAR